MEGALRAIEVTGTVDEHRQLHLDEPLPFTGSGKVRVIVLVSEEESENPETPGGADEAERLRSAVRNPAFDFLNASEEDIYAPDDGWSFGKHG